MSHQSNLSREAILDAFQKLSDKLAQMGMTGELCRSGGTAMALAPAPFRSRNLFVSENALTCA
ncbi:MAG TPA: hypothetical protein VGY98_09015 [Verrucomicrobiae bacterium]|nr:hypothetical protein [Verrucomicrobiae bacterium]